VCDHHLHGTAKRAHSLLKGSPHEGEAITEPAGGSSEQSKQSGVEGGNGGGG